MFMTNGSIPTYFYLFKLKTSSTDNSTPTDDIYY